MSTDSDAPPDTLPPELIERFRETGIRLDRNGRFWHDGQEITHKKFRRTLLRWLDTREDGRMILRLDDERYAYIEIEDAPLLVLSLRWNEGRAWLKLNDETEEELRYSSLIQQSDNTLYCQVRGGKLQARITTPAYYQLAEAIESVGDDVFAVRVNGNLFPIAVG